MAYGTGIARGMGITLRQLFKPVNTLEYPEVSRPVPVNARTNLLWFEERCTGCARCAKYCPLGIIRIVTHPSGQMTQEGDKYILDVFDIDMGRCMFCGLCVEACPYDALHMGSGFEEGKYSRKDLVIDKQRLNESPKRPSTWFRPQIENKGFDPQSDSVLKWSEAGRHEKPDVAHQEDKWVKR